MKGYTAQLGGAYTPTGEKLDDVVALVYRGPKSYTGEDVVELSVHGGSAMADGLQQALIALGYLEGDADGIFGKNTETAVKAFQKENGLTDDGIAGAQTQSALFRLYSATTAAQSAAAPTTDPNAEQAPNLPG